MSYADKVFIDMCRDIIENGTSTEGEKVRPRWEDGTPAYTIKKFGSRVEMDLFLQEIRRFPIRKKKRNKRKYLVIIVLNKICKSSYLCYLDSVKIS